MDSRLPSTMSMCLPLRVSKKDHLFAAVDKLLWEKVSDWSMNGLRLPVSTLFQELNS